MCELSLPMLSLAGIAAEVRSGTGSARACLVDRKGTLLADHSIATKTLRSTTDHRIFEQSTSDIWGALAACSKAVLAASGISGEQVKGVGFDATCSLAVVDAKGTPLSISRSADDLGGKEDDANLGKEGEWNVVLWADHRAEEEAEAINATEEGVLGFVGETMSVSHSCLLLFTRSIYLDSGTKLMLTARNGNPKGAMVEETHVTREVQAVQVL